MDVLRLGLSLSGGGSLDVLSALDAALSELSGPMTEFGTHMMESVRRNFVEQGRPEKWTPLSAATVKRKGSREILVETGTLRGSIGFSAGPDRLSVNAGVSYGAVHQHGRASSHVPPRPFLVFQDEDLTRLRTLLTSHIFRSAGTGGS